MRQNKWIKNLEHRTTKWWGLKIRLQFGGWAWQYFFTHGEFPGWIIWLYLLDNAALHYMEHIKAGYVTAYCLYLLSVISPVIFCDTFLGIRHTLSDRWHLFLQETRRLHLLLVPAGVYFQALYWGSKLETHEHIWSQVAISTVYEGTNKWKVFVSLKDIK